MWVLCGVTGGERWTIQKGEKDPASLSRGGWGVVHNRNHPIGEVWGGMLCAQCIQRDGYGCIISGNIPIGSGRDRIGTAEKGEANCSTGSTCDSEGRDNRYNLAHWRCNNPPMVRLHSWHVIDPKYSLQSVDQESDIRPWKLHSGHPPFVANKMGFKTMLDWLVVHLHLYMG